MRTLGVVAVASVMVSVAGSTLYAPHSALGAAAEIGAASLPVLTHGFALSRVPGGLARAAAVGAIAAGAWLLLLGATGLYEQSRGARAVPARRPAQRTGSRPS